MIRFGLKKVNIILLITFLTSCANINVIKIDQNLLRVDKFDNKDQFVKSYFKKFDKETSQWLPANCKDDDINILNLKSNDCEFTDMSLHMIRIAKESDETFKSSTSSEKKTNNVKEEDKEELEDNDNEESGFFMWCDSGDCNE